jgi:hypothetical protein
MVTVEYISPIIKRIMTRRLKGTMETKVHVFRPGNICYMLTISFT